MFSDQPQTPQEITLGADALHEELRARFPDKPELVEMIELKMQGWTEGKIGQKFGITQPNVSRRLKRAGVKLDPPEGVSRKIHLPSSDGKEAVTLLIEAESVSGDRQPKPFPGDLDLFSSSPPKPPDNWREDVTKAREDRDKLLGEVEDAAVVAVEAYYRKHGYEVKSVETKNLGWDLEFRKGGGGGLLRVEVKGKKCAEWPEIQVELTRNEREQSENPEHRDSYRLAIVRDALGNPKCAIYTRDGDGWKRAGDFAGDDGDAPACLTMVPSEDSIVKVTAAP